MSRNRRVITTIAIVGGATVLAAAGAAVGAAASGVAFVAPDTSTDRSAPSYAQNSFGLTYGSALDANSPEQEPDLIQAVATNGRTGYVLKSDLDEANGANAAAGFTSPEQALEWQETEGAKDRTIPVYELDGKTVIGEFLIVGTDTQRKQTQQQPED